jgi:SpoVK/Ycf46/Vps4 family AAA+-type ATPase
LLVNDLIILELKAIEEILPIHEAQLLTYMKVLKLVKKIFRDYIELHKSLDLAPILLFNEADAILSSRKTNSQSSVSQTENAIQNILLEELENFKGIFIATTNLAENLDKAFDRRFLFKIKFNNPGIASRAAIWKIKMPMLTDSETKVLAETHSLSGGQIDNIIRKAEIQSLLNDEIPNIEQLLKFCSQEIILQSGTKSIGFGKS